MAMAAVHFCYDRDDLLERLHGLAEAGLDQVMILPNFDTRFDVLERVAKDIVRNV